MRSKRRAWFFAAACVVVISGLLWWRGAPGLFTSSRGDARPRLADLPSFKEVCEATEGCETSGEKWDAWKAFFVSGFPVQKLAFLPAGTDQEIIDTYVAAFEAVRARPDFAELAAKQVGKYPMFVGEGAQKALQTAITVSPEAKAFVTNWLKDRYGVVLE